MKIVTAQQAAILVGVPVKTIYTWIDRGHLKPCMTSRLGAMLFRPADVWEAEKITRQNDPTKRRARRLATEAFREE